MHARHRSAILLGLFIVALFLVRWPIDNYTCNPNTWKHRPSPAEGSNFFQSVFRGGAGTPAIFAMLGGQRYMVANITWNYTDVLFHHGKIYDMIYPYESTVTLNPAFTEAWSTYGWHLAWNLYSDSSDVVEKERWLRAGTQVYIRAIEACPDVPAHRADLARIYAEREGNYRKALNVLEPVVYPLPGEHKFEPLTAERKKNPADVDVIEDRLWDPFLVGHRLAIIYTQLGIFTGNWDYIGKAIDLYKECLKNDPTATNTQDIIDRLESRYKARDMKWLNERRQVEAQIRERYMLPPLKFGQPIDKLWPDVDGKSGGDTGLPEKPRY